MIRVLVADDQPLVRSGLAMLLDSADDIVIVGESGDGAAAVADTVRLRPDIVIMDVRMPGMDGVEATRQIVAEGVAGTDSPVPVLILTTYHVDDAVRAALRAGASGFMLKDAAPADLISAVRAVAAGGAWLHPVVARELLTEFAARIDVRVPGAEALTRITLREREVLILIARGMSNGEIAEQLHIGEATAKTHVGRILMKLGLRDRAQAVAAAYEARLVVPGQR